MRSLAIALLLMPVAANAEDRDYCPARPGLGTPACTIAPGHVSVETALADWSRDDGPDERTDTILIGDTLVRIGLTDTIEAQIGWTPFGHVRTRDKISGAIDRTNRVGDAQIGFKANLRHPDGKGFSVAVEPFATLPVGRAPLGAGDWGAGLVVPVSFDLSDTINLEFSPEIDETVDQDGRGRHFAASAVMGVGVAITDAVTGTVEFQELRDDDPDGKTTQSLASLSLAWMPRKNWQLDVGAVAGLDRDAPDAELYLGVSRQF